MRGARRYGDSTKRLFDICISLLLLLLSLPIFLAVVGILFIANRGKVFFVQNRPGKHERLFKLLKFRTMNEKVDSDGILLPDSDRLTLVGKYIRRLSVDELPQLINVLGGDMSLVGPRPLLVEYLDLYSPLQARRHEVKPGITGWAQINGRNAISWEEKFQLDLWYVENRSLTLDLKILIKTIKKVAVRDGINSSANDTMSKFEGNIKL